MAKLGKWIIKVSAWLLALCAAPILLYAISVRQTAIRSGSDC